MRIPGIPYPAPPRVSLGTPEMPPFFLCWRSVSQKSGGGGGQRDRISSAWCDVQYRKRWGRGGFSPKSEQSLTQSTYIQCLSPRPNWDPPPPLPQGSVPPREPNGEGPHSPASEGVGVSHWYINRTSGFWPRVRARALRAPVFLGSLARQTGRCAPPAHRSFAAPPKI
jgi:hypothetical protein